MKTIKLLIKYFFIWVAVVTLSTPFSNIFAVDLMTSTDKNWLTKHPILKVTPAPDFTPTEYIDETGQLVHIEEKHQIYGKQHNHQKINWGLDTKLIVGFLIFFTISIIVGFIMWTWYLKKIVKEKTRELENKLAANNKINNALKLSESKLQIIFDNALTAIGMINTEGKFLFVNATWTKEFGFDVKQLYGLSFIELIHPKSIENISLHFENLKKGAISQFHIEIKFIKNNAPGFWGDLWASPIYNSQKKIESIIVVILDIDKRKQGAIELKRIHKELKVKNLDLVNALDDLKKTQSKLIESEKIASLGNLVAGIAHEINTPIGVGVTISTFLQEITGEIRKSFKNKTMTKSELDTYLKKTDEASQQIFRNLLRTAELIKSFKMISADQTSHEKRVFNIKSYLDDILSSLKPKFKNTKLNVHVNCDKYLNFNSYPGAFAQIITNLLINALDHAYDNEKKGDITLNISSNTNTLTLEFSDDGKGISKEDLNKIFDPFFTTRRMDGGTGLGLNIVHNIVHKTFNGEIRCLSEEGKGATFVIVMPFQN